MPKDRSKSRKNAAVLREVAEKALSKKPRKKSLQDDPVSLIHELQVHQIELEMQNEELRRSQLEIDNSKEKFLDFYDFAPVGYLTLNEKGMISELNLAAAALLGTERKFLVNKPFHRFIKSEYRDTFHLHRQAAPPSSVRQTCDLVLKKNDGTFFHTQLDSIGAEIKGQRVMRTVLTDITERKQAEEALRESEERYRTAIEHSNDGIAIVSGDKHVFVNKRFLEIFGYDRMEDVVGQLATIIAHPDDRERVLGFVRGRQRNESVPSIYEMKGEKKNGEIVNIEVSATATSFNGETASLAFLRDITERKRKEKDLAESVEKVMEAKLEWETLVDSLHEAVFLVDNNGCVIRANFTIARWGLSQPADVRGQKLHDVLHPYCMKGDCYLTKVISQGLKNSAAGRPTDLESRDDIFKKYFDIRIRPIYTQKSWATEPKSGFAVVVLHDITERRQAKESLVEAYEELKETQEELIRVEKLALLGRVSSGIAHEIRNPLANIRASAQFCLNKYDLDEEIKKHLRIMLRNSEHANKIIKDLIDLARPSEVLLKSSDIAGAIHRVCDLVKTRCEKQRVLLHVKISRRLPLILMDEERMEKALLNFVLNALDAMPRGGKLSINVYPIFDKNEVVINVLDTGKGIPKENLDKIFHPFFSTKRTGIGLGLCLADQVISSHRGKLAVDSKVGEGVKVIVRLPISPRDEAVQEGS